MDARHGASMQTSRHGSRPWIDTFMRLLGFSYKDHIIKKEVSERITNVIDPFNFKNLLSIVKTKQLRWLGRVTQANGLSKCRAMCQEGEDRKG